MENSMNYGKKIFIKLIISGTFILIFHSLLGIKITFMPVSGHTFETFPFPLTKDVFGNIYM